MQVSARALAVLLLPPLLAARPAGAQDDGAVPPLRLLAEQAEACRPLLQSDVARAFLKAVPALPAVRPRTVWIHPQTRDARPEEDGDGRTAEELAGYERKTLDEDFYWFTRYGTPLAFVRPLDLLGQAGLATVDGKRLIDFGFGSIGQLRLLASLGADVTGIEVDATLQALYSEPADTGVITRAPVAGEGEHGALRLLFGRFPAEESLVNAVGSGYDAFVSKNTLKNGYIHPAQEVDPRRLVQLGVDDATFVAAVHGLLNPGGFFLIYNLHPRPSREEYLPWADGRCPFSREELEAAGFEILAFDRVDTPAAHEMAKAFRWDRQMTLERDLLATYTLARRK